MQMIAVCCYNTSRFHLSILFALKVLMQNHSFLKIEGLNLIYQTIADKLLYQGFFVGDKKKLASLVHVFYQTDWHYLMSFHNSTAVFYPICSNTYYSSWCDPDSKNESREIASHWKTGITRSHTLSCAYLLHMNLQ